MTTTTQLWTNNAAGWLASPITAGATSIMLATGQGARFPDPASATGGYFDLTLFQRSGITESNHEIVRVTARSGDTLTVTRGQEGTTARAFNAMDPVELRVTAGVMGRFRDTTVPAETPVDLTGTFLAGATTVAVTGGYDVGRLSLFHNGSRLTENVDFTATDGANVVLATGLAVDDVLVAVKRGAVATSDLVSLSGALGSTLVGNGTETVADSLNALQLADYTALRAYAGPRKSVYVTGYLGTAAPSGIAGMFVRDDHDTTTADDNATVIVTSGGVRFKRQYRDAVDPAWAGAKYDGTADDTAAVQAIINAFPFVVIPAGAVCVVDQISIPSNRVLEIHGKVLRKPNAASDTQMFVNASGVTGDSNIIITGTGELDGNAANQSGDRQGLVRLQNPTDCVFSVRKVGNNKYGSSNPVADGYGCIAFVNATRCKVQDVWLNLWQREGIYITGTTVESAIRRIQAVGDGSNSWSACSISGAGAIGNKILDVTANNCGATSVVLDSTYSQAENIVSRNNQFNNGVNFGHTGKPATGSRASNITVINAGQGATSGTTHCGVQIGGGTTDFELSNVTVNGAYNHCIQISDGASDVQVKGANRLTGSQHGCGINAFAADKVRVSGVKAKGNSDYGINFNASNDCSVVDSDLRGNTIGPFSATGSRIMVRATPLSDDATVGSVNLAGLAAGASITVTNANVAAFSSAVNIFPRNATAAAGLPFVSNKTSTGFTVTVVNAVSAGGGPHNLSFEIL